MELAQRLSAHGLPLEVTDLTYGDFCFLGHGEADSPVPVGVERKTLQDLINSTLTGRFAGHQLPGLLSSYQDVWLVVEGRWRPGPTGLLEVPGHKEKGGKWVWKGVGYGAKQFMYKEFESLLLTLEIRGGVRVRFTQDEEGTCWFLASLYRWWTDKSLEEHRSHLRFRSLEVDAGLLIKPSLCRLVAKELPMIGWKRSQAVAEKFGTVYAMVQASEQEWQEIEGVGKVMAKRIVQSLQGTGSL